MAVNWPLGMSLTEYKRWLQNEDREEDHKLRRERREQEDRDGLETPADREGGYTQR